MDEKSLTRPLSRKVWSGAINTEKLVLETTGGVFEIPWDDVSHVIMGQILEQFDTNTLKEETAGGAALKMVPLLGDYIRTKSQNVIKRQNYFAALIFAAGHSNPFRFDNKSTNYRKLLGEDSCHSGHINYARCMKKILENTTKAKMDQSAENFIKTGRLKIRLHHNLETFSRYAWKFKENPEKMASGTIPTFSAEDFENFGLEASENKENSKETPSS